MGRMREAFIWGIVVCAPSLQVVTLQSEGEVKNRARWIRLGPAVTPEPYFRAFGIGRRQRFSTARVMRRFPGVFFRAGGRNNRNRIRRISLGGLRGEIPAFSALSTTPSVLQSKTPFPNLSDASKRNFSSAGGANKPFNESVATPSLGPALDFSSYSTGLGSAGGSSGTTGNHSSNSGSNGGGVNGGGGKRQNDPLSNGASLSKNLPPPKGNNPSNLEPNRAPSSLGTDLSGGGNAPAEGSSANSQDSSALPPNEPTRFNLAFRRREPSGFVEGRCAGTLVGKKKNESASTEGRAEFCDFSVFTAGHCVDREFQTFNIQKQGESSFHSIPRGNLEVVRDGPGNDVALVSFLVQCDFIHDSEVAKLAPLGIQGRPNLERGRSIWTRHQNGQRVRGSIDPSIIHPRSNNVVANELEGPHTVGGDSGSPIYSSEGLVGALSGGTQGRRDFSFSPDGIGWLVSRLKERGFPVSADSPPSQLAANDPHRFHDHSRHNHGSGPLNSGSVAAATGPSRAEPLRNLGSILGFHSPSSDTPSLASAGFSLPTNHLSSALKSAVDKCVKCHLGSEYRDALPAGVKDSNAITGYILGMNDQILNDMIGRAQKDRRIGMSHAEAQAIRDYVSEARKPRLASAQRSVTSTAPACYMSQAEQTRKINSLPSILGETSQLAARLADAMGAGRMMFYDRSGVPRAWQDFHTDGNSTHRILTPQKTVNMHMYGLMGYHSDAGREFPWDNPAGLDISPNGATDKFVIPPPGGLLKMVSRTRQSHPHYFGTSSNVNGPQVGWEYLPSTVFGEVLKVAGIPFEIRLRMKTQLGQWITDVLRPFGSPQEMADSLKSVCNGKEAPAGCQKLLSSGAIAQISSANTNLVNRNQFINRSNFKTARDPLSLSRTANEATLVQAQLQSLPAIPDDVREAVLSKTAFKSVFNRPWISGENASWAPTAQGASSLVPHQFFGGLIPMTQKSCMNCHDSAGRHVDNFDPHPSQMYASAPGDARRARTWYNGVRGDDGILSFHPFSADAVARGANTDANALNRCLVENGLVVR